MKTVEISLETFARLQKHARPFEDTPESVIQRALDALELEPRASASSTTTLNESKSEDNHMIFHHNSIPDLTYTSVLKAKIGNSDLEKPSWNSILRKLVELASKSGINERRLNSISGVNVVPQNLNRKNGFWFLPSVGISVQGQDSNDALAGSLSLAKLIGQSLEVVFMWQDEERAAFPGKTGEILPQ